MSESLPSAEAPAPDLKKLELREGWLDDVIKDAQETPEAIITRLTAEVERLKTSGIAEVAAHNPSVMDYMRHWEGRTLKAEAEVERLRAALAAKPVKPHRNALHTP
jgi:Asp-tRNA(Asn)/Glu-tRNA(Gln) amidotransferase B subunit